MPSGGLPIFVCIVLFLAAITSSTEIFSFKTMSWRNGTALTNGVHGGITAATSSRHGSTFVVVGGGNGPDFDTVFEYEGDGSGGKWIERKEKLVRARWWHTTIELPNDPMICGS